MALRLQLERMTGGYLPSLREYSKLYGLNSSRVASAADDVLVLHPGPMNRGMAVLYLLAGEMENEAAA